MDDDSSLPHFASPRVRFRPMARVEQWNPFEIINVRYTSLSKQDVEALRTTFEDIKIAS